MPSKGIVRAALEAVFTEEGCPICSLLGEREENWLRSLLTESVNDLRMRNRIAVSWGFCRRHAWGVAARTDLGGPLGLAIIYESLAGRLLAQYEAERREGYHAPSRASVSSLGLDAVRPGQSCVYCAAQAEVERNYIISFVKYCAHRQFVARYERSDGLCLQHLKQALAAARPSIRIWLLETALAKLSKALDSNVNPADTGWGADDPLGAMRPRLHLLAGAYPFYPHSRDYHRYARALGIRGDAHKERYASSCPLCVAERQVERERLEGFLQPDSNPPSSVAWLCPTHAWQLQALAAERRSIEAYVAWSDGLIRAAISALADLLAAERARLQKHGLPFWLAPIPPALPFPQWECAICGAKAQTGILAAADAIYAIQSRATSVGAALDPRVCFQHFPGLVAIAPPDLASSLRAGQAARLRALRSELEIYIHKVHWNYKGEPWGLERDSWRRAVDLFVGAE